MRNPGRVLLAALCLCVATACASTAPPLRDDHTALVSGRETSDLNPAEARRAVLLEAARITVDHGYQYFVVVSRRASAPGGSVLRGAESAIRPGDDVTFKVFHDGEVSSGARNVFDAQRLLTNGVPQGSAQAPVYFSRPATSPAPSQDASKPQPHCTAYGCSW